MWRQKTGDPFGPEFVSRAIRDRLGRLRIEAMYITPGSPWENGYAESFHSRLVDEFLSRELFEGVQAARELTRQWRDDYNEYRPHSSLGYLTPAEYAAGCVSACGPGFAGTCEGSAAHRPASSDRTVIATELS